MLYRLVGLLGLLAAGCDSPPDMECLTPAQKAEYQRLYDCRMLTYNCRMDSYDAHTYRKYLRMTCKREEVP